MFALVLSISVLSSEVLGALVFDDRLELDVVGVNAGQVVANAVDRLFDVVTSSDQAVLVLVSVGLTEVDEILIEYAHVLVLHAFDTSFDLVWVRHGFIHPLVLKAARGGVLHCLVAHVLEWGGQSGVDLVSLLEAHVAGRLAWLFSVVDSLIPVELLFVIGLDHVLQGLGGKLGVSCHACVCYTFL